MMNAGADCWCLRMRRYVCCRIGSAAPDQTPEDKLEASLKSTRSLDRSQWSSRISGSTTTCWHRLFR